MLLTVFSFFWCCSSEDLDSGLKKEEYQLVLIENDSPIDDPFEDISSYTVEIESGTNNPVQYRNSISEPFIDLPVGGILYGVISNKNTPFQIRFKDEENVFRVFTLYFKNRLIIPETPDVRSLKKIEFFANLSLDWFIVRTPPFNETPQMRRERRQIELKKKYRSFKVE